MGFMAPKLARKVDSHSNEAEGCHMWGPGYTYFHVKLVDLMLCFSSVVLRSLCFWMLSLPCRSMFICFWSALFVWTGGETSIIERSKGSLEGIISSQQSATNT